MTEKSLQQVFNFLQQFRSKEELLQVSNNNLKCVICKKLLNNAVQTDCGCKGCSHCLEDYLNSGSKSCPSGNPECKSIKLSKSQLYPDNATNKEIANITSKCPFDGCTVSDSIKAIARHVETCECRMIECLQCNEFYRLKDKMLHLNENCDMRLVKCPSCEKKMTNRILRTSHVTGKIDEICEKYVGCCPNKCSKSIVGNVKAHLSVCENRKVKCPFSSLSCDEEVLFTQLAGHVNEEQLKHSNILVDQIVRLNGIVETMQTTIDKLKETVTSLESKNETLMKMNTDLQNFHHSTISNNHQSIYRNGRFVWKFDNFSSKWQEARSGNRSSWISDPFYTSEFGYKLCLKVYPDGDGIGRSTHLSIFFVVMKGEYDNLLTWPFQERVTITLLSQVPNNRNRSEAFRPDPRASCYTKPENFMNLASGSPKFAPHPLLLSPSSIFLRDDCLYIEIQTTSSNSSNPVNSL